MGSKNLIQKLITSSSEPPNPYKRSPCVKFESPFLYTATSTSNGSSASKQLNGGWFDVQLKTISQTVQEESEKNGMVRNGKVIMVQNEV